MAKQYLNQCKSGIIKMLRFYLLIIFLFTVAQFIIGLIKKKNKLIFVSAFLFLNEIVLVIILGFEFNSN